MSGTYVGSFAKFKNRVTRSILPFSSKSRVKKRLVSRLTPMAPKTMEKLSSWSSCTPLVGFPTRLACLQIWAAISLWGRPDEEKMGIFWPRAMEFIVSMAEIPVEIISSGYTWVASVAKLRRFRQCTYTRVGVDGTAVDVEVVLSQHLWALVDGLSGSIEDTTQHVLGHTELQAVSGEFDFGLRLSECVSVAVPVQVPS
jgi:hypothetical protein